VPLDSTPSPREATGVMDASNPSASTAQSATRTGNVGVLLVNLGTPDTADAKGVRIYLREFLSDPRVIEDQGLVWKLILNGIILQTRPRRRARDYQKIWNTALNESPLKTITRAQAEKLSGSLDGSHIVVDWAMRYGNPSLEAGITALIAKGCDRILVVPLYPQYSASTTATVADETLRVLTGMRAQPTVRFAPPYFDDPNYIDALAVSIKEHLASLSFVPDVIVASFHGMPQAYVDNGDPYEVHCRATMVALREKLGMSEDKLKLTFQSRFGSDEWLKPYTDKTVEQLAKSGVKKIAVVTPGFSADCLETLEEIAGENAEIFRHNGGEQFSFIPCLNDSDAGMDVIRQLVMRELQGWI
jgi:ferrochelatase